MDTIRLTIDGQEVTAPKGATVLEAARGAGIYIPTLCAHSRLKPYGGCRMCIVEIEKMRGLPASCTTPAEEGMVVQTRTERVERMRRAVLELLLSEHPYECLLCNRRERCESFDTCQRRIKVTEGCVICPKNGRCELQVVADHIKLTEMRLRSHRRAMPLESSNPLIERNHDLCILCARCTRACDELQAVGAISLINRGANTFVGTSYHRPLEESDCVFCGHCVEACPTGAIVEKPGALKGVADKKVKTVCGYCGVGCGMYLEVKDGRIIRVSGDPDAPVNKGSLCVKGRFGMEFVHSAERLTKPLIKKDGKFVEATWDEALTLIASKLSEVQPGEFAAVASGRCTNEDNYLLQKFTRGVMGTNSIDHCARL